MYLPRTTGVFVVAVASSCPASSVIRDDRAEYHAETIVVIQWNDGLSPQERRDYLVSRGKMVTSDEVLRDLVKRQVTADGERSSSTQLSLAQLRSRTSVTVDHEKSLVTIRHSCYSRSEATRVLNELLRAWFRAQQGEIEAPFKPHLDKLLDRKAKIERRLERLNTRLSVVRDDKRREELIIERARHNETHDALLARIVALDLRREASRMQMTVAISPHIACGEGDVGAAQRSRNER